MYISPWRFTILNDNTLPQKFVHKDIRSYENDTYMYAYNDKYTRVLLKENIINLSSIKQLIVINIYMKLETHFAT